MLPPGFDAAAVTESARAAMPDASPTELLFAVSTEAGMRLGRVGVHRELMTVAAR